MNQYIGQWFAVLKNKKNHLIAEKIVSAGSCGFSNAASSCPASTCLYGSMAQGFFIF